MPPIRLGIKKIVRKMLVPLSAFAGERLCNGQGDHVDEHRRQEGKRHGKKNDVENCESDSART